MSHRQTQLQLSDYLDGEVAAGERLRLERHVEECASCARELSGLRQVRGLLAPRQEPRGGSDSQRE